MSHISGLSFAGQNIFYKHCRVFPVKPFQEKSIAEMLLLTSAAQRHPS